MLKTNIHYFHSVYLFTIWPFGNKINLGQLLNFNMREYARNLSAIPTQSEVDGKLVFHIFSV